MIFSPNKISYYCRMPKRGTRKAGRGLVSRVFAPVGVAMNTVGVIAKNVFKSAKRIGAHAVRGTNKVVNSVKNSVRNSKRGGRATRRRKN